jgi:hypothetical protein
MYKTSIFFKHYYLVIIVDPSDLIRNNNIWSDFVLIIFVLIIFYIYNDWYDLMHVVFLIFDILN